MIDPTLLTGQSDSHISWFNRNQGLHLDVIKPWKLLQSAAAKEGFQLEIASGFRHFERQRIIWNRKYRGETPVKNLSNEVVDLTNVTSLERIKAIMLYSALPGTSRHHWGTDLDIYAPNLLNKNQTLQLEPWEYQQGGPFASLSDWLIENAVMYGFYFPYDQFRGGVAPELWHMSYFPIAEKYQQALTVEVIAKSLKASQIEGKLDIINALPGLFNQFITNIKVNAYG